MTQDVCVHDRHTDRQLFNQVTRVSHHALGLTVSGEQSWDLHDVRPVMERTVTEYIYWITVRSEWKSFESRC